ncbi:hypothetical protein E4T56_gene8308 [Termitomyces sp. T112]|nr:hypothetical protein E4T56_gene8308 [Termitomyces sp. T112]
MPTLGNSDASLANPDNPLANSDTFSTVINTSPESLDTSPAAPLQISTSSATGPLTPTRHSMPPSSAREYLQAGTTPQHSLLMPAAPKPYSQWLPLCINDDNWTLSYINELGNSTDEPAPHNNPPQDQSPHFNLHAPHTNIPASLAEAEELFSVVYPPSAAPTEEGPSSSVVLATTNPATSSSASSQDAPTEKSMELDYTNNSLAPTNLHPEMTPQVIPSPSKVAVVTNIATLAAPEAGSSGSINMANAVLECWADIVSSEEVVALKMLKQAG